MNGANNLDCGNYILTYVIMFQSILLYCILGCKRTRHALKFEH